MPRRSCKGKVHMCVPRVLFSIQRAGLAIGAGGKIYILVLGHHLLSTKTTETDVENTPHCVYAAKHRVKFTGSRDWYSFPNKTQLQKAQMPVQ